MRILLASSEVSPWSKSGGLGDMVGALAKFLGRAGHEVVVVTPLYRGIEERLPGLRPFDWKLDLPLGEQRFQAKVRVHERAGSPTIYFIDHPGFYDRPELYQEGGADYADNAERFIFFSKAVVNLARYLPWRAEVIHVHDWQSALVAALVEEERRRGGWAGAPPVCLTIHNLAFQGIFPAAKFALTNLPPEYFRMEGLEFYGGMSCLKAGISFASLITTVSPRYAREITTEEFGCGLDAALRQRREALVGILNGVDYEEWTTVGNPYLSRSYTAEDLRGKAVNKAQTQEEFGLPPRAGTPLFGTVARLAEQKGVDIQLAALEEMLAADLQFILLGSGGREFERGYRKLALRYPGKCAVKFGFDAALSHRIESACDFFLMPSRFEPCGLNQMYSLRYGTVPVVRATGGLDDTVTDATEDPARADGIKFREYSARALAKAIRKALVLYGEKELLDHYRRNGMGKDFSWERTAVTYEKVYQEILRARQTADRAEPVPLRGSG
jgi:starch synthase